jgi:protein-glucosylgalactosylhydroxylysine glucosidase
MAIDRRSLVSRHNPVLRSSDPRSPLSVGNGEIAFSVDATGLQTFRAAYEAGVPLCTQSQWGWHSFLTTGDEPSLRLEEFASGGRTIGYPTSSAGQDETFHRLRRNPHRLNLGAIAFRLPGGPGRTTDPDAIDAVRQELNLWMGIIASTWRFDATPVTVATCCHPTRDAVSVRVESSLCADGRFGVEIAFPYGSPEMNASDWASPGAHHSLLRRAGPQTFDIERALDATRYLCRVHLGDGVELHREDAHRFLAAATPGARRLSLVIEFLREPGSGEPPTSGPLDARAVEEACARHWPGFWQEGGCVELAGSRDPRGLELERRIVLSQYLSAIQCAGSLPPQETGLTCNSWYGKFHLEMHYWHAAHFPLWGRPGLLERSLGWYGSIRDLARRRAREQGFDGARWPKMSGPDGGESPSAINPLIIWQQPHPVMLAELVHRARPGRQTLERYADLVFESAEFMASFAREEEGGACRFVLRPPIVPAQENHDPRSVLNPAFELEYWDYGLRTAIAWRERLGLLPEPRWERVLDGLSDLPVADGHYLSYEGCPETWGEHAVDHPSMLCALGMLPGSKVDRAIMNRTLDAVLRHWKFPEAWGWDFPVIAMSAARLGRPGDAVDALLMDTPKNTYLPNGHNAQGGRRDLPLYLPGNGGLLIAVAAMAAGWDGAPDGAAPGFPEGWRVAREGLLPVP